MNVRHRSLELETFNSFRKGWTSNLEKKIKAGEYGFDVNELGRRFAFEFCTKFEFLSRLSDWSLLSSMLNIGAALICLLMGYIINLIGRRRTMLLILVPFVAGWIMLITAVNVTMLIVGRALIGVACGGICVSGPVRCSFVRMRVSYCRRNFLRKTNESAELNAK